MSGSLFTIEQLPTTSAAAIRVFDERYLAALGAVKPTGWTDKIGDFNEVSSPYVTFPISALSLKYQKTREESRFKRLGPETSFDIKAEEFDEGVEAPLLDLFTQTYAYRKWTEAPKRLMLAEERHRARTIAQMLEDGVNITGWDGKKFFATNHPANFADSGAGTFSNYQATPASVLDVAKIAAEVSAMMAVKDEQGEKMGITPDTIIVPVEKAEALKNLLAQALILDSTGAAAVNNPYYGGRFNIVVAPELTDADDWYLVDSKLVATGMPPWAVLRYSPPQSLGLRRFDESSDYFKETGNLRISSHIWYGFGLVFPHAIRLVKGA
jgi:hypothetical protein